MNNYIPSNIKQTPVTYKETLKHKLSIASEVVFANSSRHVELDSTYTLKASTDENNTLNIVSGIKDGNAAIVWDATPTTLATAYYLEDFIKLSSTSALAIMRHNTGVIKTAVVSFTAPATVVINAVVIAVGTIDAVALSIKGCLIATNKVIIVYKDTSDSKPYAIVCSIAGTVPSYGAAVLMKDATVTAATSLSVCTLTTTTFFATYDNGTNTYGHILSFDGTLTITINTESLMVAALETDLNCDILDSTHVVVSYANVGDNLAKAIIAIITGVTISSWGAAYSTAVSSVLNKLRVLSATKFILFISDSSATMKAVVATTNSTQIFYGVVAEIPTQVVSTLGALLFVDATHVTFSVYNSAAAAKRGFYGTITIDDNDCYFNEMTVLLATCAASTEIRISLIVASMALIAPTASIYLGGNEITDKTVSVKQWAGAAVTDTEFGRGILRLPNSPLNLVAGEKIYVGWDCVTASNLLRLTACGMEVIL